MPLPKWTFATERGDFMPIVVGVVFLLISLPPFLLVLFAPDRNSGVIGTPVLVVLGCGILIAAGFIVMGIRLCSDPGSLAYRITHGRIFSR